MSRRSLAQRSGAFLADRTTRRSFLHRTALGATALSVAPGRFLLEPISAYAAICSCSGSSCDCGARCCDGYTEFCCTITGQNSCPGGTALGGWWKADGSGLCSGGPRYYMDCNVVPPANPCACGCANGSCGNRKACCTRFRYGQCHQEIASMGAIMCRVVTCTPPWQFDATCTTTPLTDNNTRFHDAPCLHAAPAGPVSWYLRNTNSQGPADRTFAYGRSDYRFLAGDWTGKGYDSAGIWDPATATFHLRNTNSDGPPNLSITFGSSNSIPLVGDWTAKGYDSIGIYDPATATFHLRNSNTPGPPDISVTYGARGYVPLVGDWNGDGRDTIGVWDPATATFHLRDSNTPGPPNHSVRVGSGAYTPVVGDWTGVGRDGVGAYVDGGWTLRLPDASLLQVRHGARGSIPVVGDWDGGGADSIGVVAAASNPPPSATTTWVLRNSNSPGGADLSFPYGLSTYPVVVGDWNGDGVDGIGVLDPATGRFHLRDTPSPGAAQYNVDAQFQGAPVAGRWSPGGPVSVGSYADGRWRLRRTLGGTATDVVRFGATGYLPVVGDWTGKGYDSIGVWDPATATFHLRNSNTPGPPDLSISYGARGYLPVVGDWNGDGTTTIGVWDPATATFHLRNSNTPGPPDLSITYGASSYRPVVGDWNGDGTTTIGVLV